MSTESGLAKPREQRVVLMSVAEGKTGVESIENLRLAIERTIQNETTQGWRYVNQVESLALESPGCLAAFFLGRKTVSRPIRFLVFER